MHRLGTDPASPRVMRVECMPLDCGGAAVVVELDCTPERAWMKALKRAVHADEMLEGAQAKFDGRFVYVVGVEAGLQRAQHRIVQHLLGREADASAAHSSARVAAAHGYALTPGRGRTGPSAALDVRRTETPGSRGGRDIPMDGVCG